MNLLEHFRQLANFDEWANREVLTTFRKDGPPTMRSLGWMAHIVAAEHLWLARIEQQASPSAGVAGTHTGRVWGSGAGYCRTVGAITVSS